MNKYIMTGCGILVVLLVVVGVLQPDRLDFACRLIGLSDTVYAPGFSRAKFTRVTIGMPRQQVEALLGRGFQDFNAHWYTGPSLVDSSRRFYSATGGGGNHWRFWITFDESDKVSRIQKEFWWD